MATISMPASRTSAPLFALTAGDVMVKDCFVRKAEEPVAVAFELLQRTHVRHIVICNEQRHVVGIIDDRRLARVLGRMSWDELSQPLSRYMDRAVCRSPVDEPLPHVARLLESSASDAVAITDAEGRLLGLVTPAEIVRAVAHRRPAAGS